MDQMLKEKNSRKSKSKKVFPTQIKYEHLKGIENEISIYTSHKSLVQKILNIKYFSTYEIAYCNINRRDWGNNYWFLDKQLGINKENKYYQIL